MSSRSIDSHGRARQGCNLAIFAALFWAISAGRSDRGFAEERAKDDVAVDTSRNRLTDPRPATTFPTTSASEDSDLPTLLRAGNDALTQKQPDAAAKFFGRALKLDPDSIEASRGRDRSLDVMYARGLAEGDLAQAVGWYRKTAELGHPAAQRALGRCYAKGTGVEPNATLAQEWFAKAIPYYRSGAGRGEAGAQNMLGMIYEARDGPEGVAQNYDEAFQWYQQAAHQGLAIAETNLGRMYRDGLGTTADRKAAIFWLRRAARQNEPEAIKLLKSLNSN